MTPPLVAALDSTRVGRVADRIRTLIARREGAVSAGNMATKADGRADMMNLARWYRLWYAMARRAIKPTGALWTFCNWRSLPVVMRAAFDATRRPVLRSAPQPPELVSCVGPPDEPVLRAARQEGGPLAPELDVPQSDDSFSPTKLQELIVHVVSALGTVGRVRLTKLLYLIDLEHFAQYGTTLTGASWVRWEHGPMIRGLLALERDLIGHEVTIEQYADNLGRARVDYHSGPTQRFGPNLRTHERELIGAVLDAYGGQSLERLLAVAYSTPPMRLIAQWEADNEQVWGTAIPFGRALGTPSSGLRPFRAIADAVRLPNRGTPQERAEVERETMAALAPLREHVNRAFLESAE